MDALRDLEIDEIERMHGEDWKALYDGFQLVLANDSPVPVGEGRTTNGSVEDFDWVQGDLVLENSVSVVNLA